MYQKLSRKGVIFSCVFPDTIFAKDTKCYFDSQNRIKKS